MKRIVRTVAVATALLLTASVAAPVWAFDGGNGGIQVKVVVSGYIAGQLNVGGTIRCNGIAEGIGFGVSEFVVTAEGREGTSGPFEVPAGGQCWIRGDEVGLGDPGDLGEWGEVSLSGPVTIVAGQVATLPVAVERWYNGAPPEWDNRTWFPMEVFTVDKVYLNRYGGITAEGMVLCSALGEWLHGQQPVGTDPTVYIGINWDATQYVGRRTAIHGSYGSDIAKVCYDTDHPTTPVRWQSMHPSGAGAEVAWVYGVDGRFGSGTIRIDADSFNDMSTVTQWWDPSGAAYNDACTTVDANADGWYDSNGDGFCAYYVEAGQRTTANVRTITLRTK